MRKWILLSLVLGLSWLAVGVVLAPGTASAHLSSSDASVSALSSPSGRAAPFLVAADVPLTTPLLYEGFEDTVPPADWLAHVEPTDANGWGQTAQYTHSGSYSAFQVYNSRPITSWLVTAQVTPTFESQLVFWHGGLFVERYMAHSLWVSTNRQDPRYDMDYTRLCAVDPPPPDDEAVPVWEPITVSLSAYAGQPIYLAFRYDGDRSDEWYLDDVMVTTEGLHAANDGPTPLGQPTTFVASVPSGRSASFEWDYGDSTAHGTGAVVTHTYPAVGVYTAVVTASNSVSSIARTTVVTVRSAVYLPLVLRQ